MIIEEINIATNCYYDKIYLIQSIDSIWEVSNVQRAIGTTGIHY